MTPDTPALRELAGSDVEYEALSYGRVDSIEEASERRGVPVAAIVKTLVVRRGDGDYVLVLVPGDRVIDWPALRSHLGVSRLSLASTEEAYAATGYERGAITPFGTTSQWPVVADERVNALDPASIGGGAHGVAVHLAGAAAVAHLGAAVASVTKPA